MMVFRCDKCGAALEGRIMEHKSIRVGIGTIGHDVELCERCARPLIRALQRAQLRVEELEQQGLIKSPTA